jgi:hypothetical protein
MIIGSSSLSSLLVLAADPASAPINSAFTAVPKSANPDPAPATRLGLVDRRRLPEAAGMWPSIRPEATHGNVISALKSHVAWLL